MQSDNSKKRRGCDGGALERGGCGQARPDGAYDGGVRDRALTATELRTLNAVSVAR